MFDAPLDLSNARVLISNDDGIHATGIQVLEEAIRPLVKEVWVVAPESEQSGAGHSLTLRSPLRYRKVKEFWYAVDGTPTDSVLVACNQILKDKQPDIILSGINRGANLGEDVTYSGTVSAAMEGTLLGIPSIALSQIVVGGKTKWATSAHYVPEIVRKLVSMPWPRSVLMNVNIPAVDADEVSGLEITRQGRRRIGGDMIEQIDPRGMPIYWIGIQREHQGLEDDTDLSAINRNAIAITPLSMEMTHEGMMGDLKKVFP